MDTKTIVLPSMVCLTLLFILYYHFYNKKSKEKKEKLKSNNDNKKENENIDEKKEIIETNEKEKENNEEEEEENENETEEKEEIKEKEKEDDKSWRLTFDKLFDKFCEYIQNNKLVSVDAIAEKLNKSKEDTIKFLRELEKEGKTQGFLGDDGEYFFLTMKELELLNNLLVNSKKKIMSEEELQKQFDEITQDRAESLF